MASIKAAIEKKTTNDQQASMISRKKGHQFQNTDTRVAVFQTDHEDQLK